MSALMPYSVCLCFECLPVVSASFCFSLFLNLALSRVHFSYFGERIPHLENLRLEKN